MPNLQHSAKLRARVGGFTLVELLVVIAIIGALLGLLLPAVMSAREAARRTSCQNNLKQIGLAIQNYESTNRRFPPSFVYAHSTSWSVHGRILPYLEQANAYSQIRLDLEWHDPINLATGIQTLKIDAYTCPSDPHSDQLFYEGPEEGFVRPVNYGFNFGSWFVFAPRSGSIGEGCFHPNVALPASAITDGLSNTLCAADVKSYQAYFRNSANPGGTIPPNPQYLSAFAGGAQFKLGQELNDNAGHVEWCDGPVHESGFTSVFTPNQFVAYEHSDGHTYDIDFNSRYEGTSRTQPTYAAVTSRSYHSGIVQVVLMDGSVQTMANSIDLSTWRSLSTRAGSEVMSGEH